MFFNKEFKRMAKHKHIPLDYEEFSILNNETDELVQCKALDSRLCLERLSSMVYISIPSSLSESDPNFSKYQNSIDSIIGDLSWILSLDYAKFWCQVVNDESVHCCINSYLRLSPRFKQELWPKTFVEQHNNLHRLVFMVCLRMSTPKESSENFMTPKFFANLLYENFLFDIPSLMDICSLYAVPQNVDLLKKMISSIFQHQPAYFDDLENSSTTILQVFTELEKKCGFYTGDSKDGKPAELNDGLPDLELLKLNANELEDIVLYLSDVLHTLNAFSVVVYDTSCEYFYKAGILSKFGNCYCNVLPKLQSVITDRSNFWEKSRFNKLRIHLKQCREQIKSISHHFIKVVFCDTISDYIANGKRDYAVMLVESYLKFLSDLLSHQKFVRDLNKASHLATDLETVMTDFPDICEEQYSYILHSLNQTADSKPKKKKTDISTEIRSSDLEPHCSSSQPHSGVSDEVSALVQSVRDVFPGLENKFIENCLRRCDMSPEKVIQLILEDNLPPDISENGMAVNQNHAANHPLGQTSNEDDFTGGRQNVFDRDEFDVFHRDAVDRTMIHRGKAEKPEVPPHWRMEEEVEKLKELYSRYGIVEEEGSEEEFGTGAPNPSLYDDEYDDTYDDVAAVNEDDTLGDDEALSRRPFVTPRFFLQGKNSNRGKVNNEQSSDDSETEKPKRDEFIQNPEIVRAKKEERWRQKQSERQGNRGPSSSGGNTEKERKKKEANKSSRANHNRRNLASRKFAKAMT